jgi:uncharacterized protein YegP (UPF0339 family)
VLDIGSARVYTESRNEHKPGSESACTRRAVSPSNIQKAERNMIMGKFEVKEVKSGIKFNLKAGNGEVIAVSEIYTTENACMNGIESVRKSCMGEIEDQTVEGFEVKKHPKFEVYKDKAGEFRFRLKARNGEIVVTGEGYKAKASCLKGIESIKKNAPEAPVVKVEE